MGLLALLGLSRPERRPSLVDDLRRGRAGLVVRGGLSLAAAAALLAACMLILGLVELTDGRVQEEHIALVLCIAGAIWCGMMMWLWGTYRRFQRLIRTIFAILGVWVVTTPLCITIAEVTYRADFIIAGFILAAVGLTIGLIVTAAYRGTGGKLLRGADGHVRVHCPRCAYSLVGNDSCRCPECGLSFTLDQLIAAQDYAVLRPGLDGEPGDDDEGQATVADDDAALEVEVPPLAALPHPAGDAARPGPVQRARS